MNWSSIERRSVEASYLNKFKLISTVNKHHGCVNRLCWTSDGKLLASCSDDLKVNLWNCNTGASIASIRTPHSNNVLDVKFLGYTNSFDNYSNNENNNDSYNTNNIVLLTCSVDSTISVMSLSDSYDVLLSNQYYCHLAAVKSIETDYNSPNVFFSAGDDGIVRQYDDRLNDLGCTNTGIERSKGSMYDSNNCLLATRHGIKINSMRINPTDYNQFVIASTDSTVRTYDRRMLSLHYPKSNIQVESIGSYCPHHLLNESAAYPTYAEFSPCGRNIVASYHGDHSYLFNNSTAVDIASETEMVEDKGRGKADLPWRKKYNNLLTLSEKLKNIKTLIDTGKKTIDLGLNVTSTNVFGRAIELSSYAISEAKSYSQAYENQSANIFGTSLRTDINSSIVSAFHTTASDLNDCVDLYISALQKRVDIFEKRAYLGDNIAGLRDIEEILRYHPYDVDCIVRKIEFLLQANRPELALSSLNEVQDLLLIQSTQADVLTHTQQKIQNLHNLAVEQIQSLRTRNSRDSRNRQLLNQSDAQLGDSSLKRGYFDMMMKNSANTNVSNKKPRLDDRGTGTLAMTSLIMPELQKSKISQIVIPRVIDYCQRYLGAANIAIEMKEIVFLGINGEVIKILILYL